MNLNERMTNCFGADCFINLLPRLFLRVLFVFMSMRVITEGTFRGDDNWLE